MKMHKGEGFITLWPSAVLFFGNGKVSLSVYWLNWTLKVFQVQRHSPATD
ncbi:MAG: hypothetical protein ACR2QM_07455 [Longimicrobiales bacterium]